MSITFDVVYDNGEKDKMENQGCFAYFNSYGYVYFPTSIKRGEKKEEIRQKVKRYNYDRQREIGRKELIKLGYGIREIIYYPDFCCLDKNKIAFRKWIPFIIHNLFPGIVERECTVRTILRGKGVRIPTSSPSLLVMQVLVCLRYLEEYPAIIENWFNLYNKYKIDKKLAFILSHFCTGSFVTSHTSMDDNRVLDMHHLFLFLRGRLNEKIIEGNLFGKMNENYSCSTTRYYHPSYEKRPASGLFINYLRGVEAVDSEGKIIEIKVKMVSDLLMREKEEYKENE